MDCFRCSRTGMFFPADYVEKWGMVYGIGLGPEPISECLTNRYDIPIAASRDDKSTMHPVGVSRAQVDFVSVTPEDFEARRAILANEDPFMKRRAVVMRERQIVHDPVMKQLFPEEAALLDAEVVEEPEIIV